MEIKEVCGKGSSLPSPIALSFRSPLEGASATLPMATPAQLCTLLFLNAFLLTREGESYGYT